MYKKHLILNLSLLGTLFIVVFLLNFIIDPYNYNNIFKLDLDKKNVSYKQNYRLYKMLEYREEPKNYIVLGDSRGGLLQPNFFKNHDVYNFAYGGGSLDELIDTFWYATEKVRLKNVVFVIPFSMYNQYEYINQTKEAQLFISKPHKYYFSLFVTKISFLNIYTSLFNENKGFQNPNLYLPNKNEKMDYWKGQLYGANRFYAKYKYPKNLFLRLQEIKKYSKLNDINLIFLLPPSHMDLQNKTKDFNLEKEYLKYKNDIFSLGVTFDCDFESEVTSNMDNFTDPLHYSSIVAENIVSILTQNRGSNAMCLKY